MNAIPNRILVPLDGSHLSESVLASLMPLIRAHPSEVTLLTVIANDLVLAPVTPYLMQVAEALRVHDIPTTFAVGSGEPAPEIVRYAREHGSDWIAMSTHGRTGLTRAWMGSVTEEVLRHTNLPVLTYRPGALVSDCRKIVVTLDGSPESEEILPEACRMALLLGATLHLTRVAVPIIMVGGITDYPVSFPPENPRPYLDTVVRRCRELGVGAEPVSLFGDPAGEIVRHAQETGAGMICMGSHGRTGLSRVVMGSVAEQVVRHAPCPVLVRRYVPVNTPVQATALQS